MKNNPEVIKSYIKSLSVFYDEIGFIEMEINASAELQDCVRSTRSHLAYVKRELQAHLWRSLNGR